MGREERGIVGGIERLTAATMEARPLLQFGAGLALLVGAYALVSVVSIDGMGLFAFVGGGAVLGSLVLLVTAIARGLLTWMDADSYADATTGQQLLVLAAGTFVVVGVPLIALIVLAYGG